MIRGMNPTSDVFWEHQSLPFNEWNSLDQLWLLMTRKPHELAISYCYGEARIARWLQFSALTEVRYPVAGTLKATSRLSPRPVVARPNQPVHLPCGEKVTLFVGTSLWFCLTRDNDNDPLLDVPVARLSDTWFGPDTWHGEICYACPTHARLSMEGVAPNPFKAITPVEIRNENDKPLLIDRMNLPIPYLALYKDAERHWTSQVTITRTSVQTGGEVHVSTHAPRFARSPIEVAPARKKLEGGMLHKAMSLLLG